MADRGSVRGLGLGVAAGLFLLDQLVKYVVTWPLALPARGVIDLLPIFRLQWVQNTGVSMGFLTADGDAGRWLLVALTLAIVIGVGLWLWRERSRADAVALGLVMGGAIGNILDRVRLGYVVDFLNLHFGDYSPFLVFNVADASITIGVLLLVLRALLTREVKRPAREDGLVTVSPPAAGDVEKANA